MEEIEKEVKEDREVKGPKLKFIEVLKQNNDYDVVKRESSHFGFCSFKSKVSASSWKGKSKPEGEKKKFTQLQFDGDDEVDENLILADQEVNKYENLTLIDCAVNLFALKKIIRENLDSLREIYIKDCKFYLSDDDAIAKRNPTTNLRMLQEINFVWLIEQLKFVNIEIIEIKLMKEHWMDESIANAIMNYATQHILKQAKVAAGDTLAETKHKNGDHDQPLNPDFNLEKLKEVFDCEEGCKFLEFEESEKYRIEQLLSKEKMAEFANYLVWDRVQSKDDFWDKLYENILTDIQQNLTIYKKYSKFAFNGVKLMIIGDVLNNSISQSQLYNVIHLNCSRIQGIIFSGNGHIRMSAFSDLMTQLFLIPQLESIAFISSVLDEGSLFELQYLILQKGVKFLVLNQSYFLKDEIDELLETQNSDSSIDINHFRFVVLDVLTKKQYEFCPYSFNMETALEKKDDELLAAERLYVFQKHYPKQIQEEINFYHARNVSILHNKYTQKVLFENWELCYRNHDENKETYKNQEKLVRIIEEIIKEDSVNILNYCIVKKLVGLVLEIETQKALQDLINQLKSFKYLCQTIPENLSASIKYRSYSHLKLCHSYLLGFSRQKVISPIFILKNDLLYNDIYDQESIDGFVKNPSMYILQELITGNERDEKSNQILIKNFSEILDLSKLKKLSLYSITPKEGNFSFLNELVKHCVNLKEFKFFDCTLNEQNLEGVDLSGMSPDLEICDVGFNPTIRDMSFLNKIFAKCKKLKEISFYNNQITPQVGATVDFSLLTDTLELFNLSYSTEIDASIVNPICKYASKLKNLNLYSAGVKTSEFLKFQFPATLKTLNLSYNNDLKISDTLIYIGKNPELQLEKFSFYGGIPFDYFDPIDEYLLPESLPGLGRIKNFAIQKNGVQYEKYLTLMLKNIPNVEELVISEMNIINFSESGLYDLAKNLVSLNLSYLNPSHHTESLIGLFKKTKKLKKLDLSFTCLEEDTVKLLEDSIPQTIEEINFEGQQLKMLTHINSFMKRCKKLKILNLGKNNFKQQYIQYLDFTLLGPDFEELILDNIYEIEDYTFINTVFQTCPKLKRISLLGVVIKESAKKINFSLAGPFFKQFDCDKVDTVSIYEGDEKESMNYFGYEFNDWLMNRGSFVFGIYEFEADNLQKFFDGRDINYFDIFEQNNISTQIDPKGTWNQDDDDDEDEEKEEEEEEVEVEEEEEVESNSDDDDEEEEEEEVEGDEDEDEEEEEEVQVDCDDVENQEDKDKKEEKKRKHKGKSKIKRQKSFRESEKDLSNEYLEYTNPWYFYTFFKEFNILLPESPDFSVTAFMEKLKIVSFSNVFQEIDFQLLLFISQQQENVRLAAIDDWINKDKPVDPIDALFKLPKTKLLTLPDKYNREQFLEYLQELEIFKKYNSLDYLQFFFNNCPNLTFLNFSHSQLTVEKVKNITVAIMTNVNHIDLSGNSFKEENLSGFIDILLLSCPNLKKLNLSDMDIGESVELDLSNVSPTLEDIDISDNKDFPVHPSLRQVLNACPGLKRLIMSNLNLNKLTASMESFENISLELIDFNISNNPKLNSSSTILWIIKQCQKLKRIDISNCKLTSNVMIQLSFDEISCDLEELNFSGNSIKQNELSNLHDMFSRSKGFRKLNLSNLDLGVNTTFSLNIYYEVSLEEIDFSNNANILSLNCIEEILQQSKNFKKLTIKKELFQSVYLEELKLENNAKKIQELDMSDQGYVPEVKQLEHLKNSENFRLLNASNSAIPGDFFEKVEIFKNMVNLNLSDCKNITSVDFLSNLFAGAQKLEILDISGTNATNKSFKSVDFKKTPKSLRKLYIDEYSFTDYSFVSSIFEATAGSLELLSLYKCGIDSEKLAKIDFSKASSAFKDINLLENPEIKSIEPFRAFFKKGPNHALQAIRFSKVNYPMLELLAEFYPQIGSFDIPKQVYEVKFFKDEKNILEFDMIVLIHHLNNNKLKGRMQDLWNSNDQIGNLLRQLIKSLVDFAYKDMSIKMVRHYIFLIITDQKIPLKSTFQNPLDFLILSPYSFFQQANKFEKLAISSSSPTPSSNTTLATTTTKPGEKAFLANSFHITMNELEVLKNKNYKYIFSFTKFHIEEFSQFYSQNMPDDITDFDFTLQMNQLITENGLQRAFLPIRLQLTNKVLEKNKYDEFQALVLVNNVPPSTVTIKGLSVQFVKSWYAINYCSPLSISTTIDIDYESIENSSIANFLALRTFRMYIINFEAKTFKSGLKKKIGLLGYSFFKAFSSPPTQYRFDHTVIQLENRIKDSAKRGQHSMLSALYPIYLFICIFAVWYFQIAYGTECGAELPKQTYITYWIFGAITFMIEAYIFQTLLKFVSHLIPDLKPNCRINFPNPIVNKVKVFIMDFKWVNRWYVNYTLSFLNSQIARFDFLTNIGFLYSTYSCKDDLLFLLTLISLGFVNGTNFIFFISSFFGESKYGFLITRQIDRLYQISSLLGFQSVAELLDVISPTNSVIIFKKMFNQRIVQNFIRIIFQDMPLIVIKTAFLIRQQKTGGSTIYPIVSSSLMFVSSMSKFLAITPSRLGQEDFNELAEIKKKRILPVYLDKLKTLETQITKYNLTESLKSIKSGKYYLDQMSEMKQVKKANPEQELELFKTLMKFEPNKISMKDLFGNTRINEVSKEEIEQQAVRFEERDREIGSNEKLNNLLLQDEKGTLLESKNIILVKDQTSSLTKTLNQGHDQDSQKSLLERNMIDKILNESSSQLKHEPNGSATLLSGEPMNLVASSQQESSKQKKEATSSQQKTNPTQSNTKTININSNQQAQQNQNNTNQNKGKEIELSKQQSGNNNNKAGNNNNKAGNNNNNNSNKNTQNNTNNNNNGNKNTQNNTNNNNNKNNTNTQKDTKQQNQQKTQQQQQQTANQKGGKKN